MYYLQSRYYDPKVGRFLNADVIFDHDVGIIGYDLFTYCGNNPVRYIDISGTDCTDMLDGDFDEDDPYTVEGGGGHGGRNPVPPGSSGSSGEPGSGNTATLYRAVSNAEYTSISTTNQFSSGANSYEDGKFFATTPENANRWGTTMHRAGEFHVINATFKADILSSPGVVYYSSLDGIGDAYFVPISALNYYIVAIE